MQRARFNIGLDLIWPFLYAPSAHFCSADVNYAADKPLARSLARTHDIIITTQFTAVARLFLLLDTRADTK